MSLADLLQKMEANCIQESEDFATQCNELPVSILELWMKDVAETLKDREDRASRSDVAQVVRDGIRVIFVFLFWGGACGPIVSHLCVMLAGTGGQRR